MAAGGVPQTLVALPSGCKWLSRAGLQRGSADTVLASISRGPKRAISQCVLREDGVAALGDFGAKNLLAKPAKLAWERVERRGGPQ